MSSSSSPCAACKLLRRKCTQGCVFAPYFPPDQPGKFANVHKVFGASNVSKLLNDLPAEQREDAVNSLAYEAEARLRDPVYGCVAYISVLQLKIKQVRDQIADARKELAGYIGPAAFAPIAAPGPQYLGGAAQQYGGLPVAAGMGALGYHHNQMAALQQQQHQQHGHHHHHHHQQMVDAQQMAAAVEVAREQQDMMLRQQQAAYAGATVAVEPPGSADQQAAYEGAPFLLHHQQPPPSSAQQAAAMALSYRMEPSPPPQSSGHSHAEVSHAHHHHHHNPDGSDEGSGGAAPQP